LQGCWFGLWQLVAQGCWCHPLGETIFPRRV
jgi:hypothetical protein